MRHGQVPHLDAIAHDGREVARGSNLKAIIPVSARTGAGTEDVLKSLFELLPEGEPFYDEEQVTTQTEREIAGEIVREKALRLLHPYMPFVTEEVAHQLGFLGDGETIMRAPFPTGYGDEEKAKWGLSQDVFEFVNAKREAITALRALRAEYKVPPSTWVKATIATDDDRARGELDSLKRSMRAESIEFAPAASDFAMPSRQTAFGTVFLSLEGLVDKAAEAKRISSETAKLAGFIKNAEAKLANENFVAHAPEAVVAEARRKLAENRERLAQLEKLSRLFA